MGTTRVKGDVVIEQGTVTVQGDIDVEGELRTSGQSRGVKQRLDDLEARVSALESASAGPLGL